VGQRLFTFGLFLSQSPQGFQLPDFDKMPGKVQHGQDMPGQGGESRAPVTALFGPGLGNDDRFPRSAFSPILGFLFLSSRYSRHSSRPMELTGSGSGVFISGA
jgi:hypothetical protein